MTMWEQPWFTSSQCLVLESIWHKFVHNHPARANYFGHQALKSCKVILFKERLAGNVCILVPVLENDTNAKRMFLVLDLGDNPAEQACISKKFNHFWRKGFLLAQQVKLQLFLCRKIPRRVINHHRVCHRAFPAVDMQISRVS